MCARIPFLCASIYFLSFLRISSSSAVPEKTTFSSPTKTSGVEAFSPTSCPVICSRKVKEMTSITWSKKFITATITAETLLFVVNRRTNSTRTTTITNTEVDLANYTALTNTNSAGTQTTTVVVTAGDSIETHIVAFPTVFYADYPSSYTFCGTLPTVVDGSSTCLRQPCAELPFESASNNQNIVLPYPSRPLYVPIDVQTIGASDLSQDPKGLIYEPGWAMNDLMDEELEPLFPDLGFWKCKRGIFAAPAEVKEAAFYVTATSTSTEPGEGSTTSVISLNEAATTLPEPGLSGSSNGLLLAPITTSQATAAGVHPAASTAGPKNRSPSARSSADAVAPFASPQGSQTVEAASIIAPPATALTADTLGSQSAVDPSVTDSNAASKTGTSVDSSLVLMQPSDVQGPQAATTTPKRESGPPTIPTIPPNQAPTTPQPLALETQTITRNSQHKYLLGSQTFTPGQPVTLASNHVATWLLQQPSSSSPTPSTHPINPTLTFTPPTTALDPLPPLILNSQTLSANKQNQYIVDGQTLTPGGTIIASGNTISLAPSATQLIVGTTTEGFGWFIMSGLGGGGGAGGSASGSASRTGSAVSGGARGRGKGWGRWMVLLALVVWF